MPIRIMWSSSEWGWIDWLQVSSDTSENWMDWSNSSLALVWMISSVKNDFFSPQLIEEEFMLSQVLTEIPALIYKLDTYCRSKRKMYLRFISKNSIDPSKTKTCNALIAWHCVHTIPKNLGVQILIDGVV